jgi:two-component system response regulator FixJ
MFDYHVGGRVSSPSAPSPASGRSPAPTSCAVPRTESASGSGFPVYLVEADRGARVGLARDLAQAGFETRPFADADDLAAALPELAPGCVLLDIIALPSLPPALRDEGGTGPLRFPTILFFSSLGTEDAICALRLGAADLLPRPAPLDLIAAAVRRAAPKVRDLGLRLAARRARAAVKALTRREREVMDCVMRGFSSKEMARRLGISPRTVDMHRRRLHRRLRVSSLAELLALGWRARAGPE